MPGDPARAHLARMHGGGGQPRGDVYEYGGLTASLLLRFRRAPPPPDPEHGVAAYLDWLAARSWEKDGRGTAGRGAGGPQCCVVHSFLPAAPIAIAASPGDPRSAPVEKQFPGGLATRPPVPVP